MGSVRVLHGNQLDPKFHKLCSDAANQGWRIVAVLPDTARPAGMKVAVAPESLVCVWMAKYPAEGASPA